MLMILILIAICKYFYKWFHPTLIPTFNLPLPWSLFAEYDNHVKLMQSHSTKYEFNETNVLNMADLIALVESLGLSPHLYADST